MGHLRKLLLVGVPAALLSALLAATLIELWVRAGWDDGRGTPGFYVSDAALGQRLGAGYDGWFAGVPVKINNLGFRDTRDYALAKSPGTVRVLVLGDSVTFGHGATFETTYPYQLELRLKQWRPDVNWQVWNLGVPGYSTADELAYLNEVGDRFNPDLVIVGFYPNDIAPGMPRRSPGYLRRASSAIRRQLQSNLYSYEFYRRALLTLRWRLTASEQDRQFMERLVDADKELQPSDTTATAADQQITEVDYFDDQAMRDFTCPKWQSFDGGGLQAQLTDGPGAGAWRAAVKEFQQLHRDGRYRVVFFANLAPMPCGTEDRFHDAGSLADDAAVREILGQGTPVVSSTRAFLHYRPSQMPAAAGHSLGNSNRVKADVLFQFLRDETLPGLLPSVP
ncbi:MAG: SGNH/GDSL hydrolase family protein [Vicinamibacterales bacterium]